MSTLRPISSIDPHYREFPMRYNRTMEVVIKTGVLSYELPEDNFMNDKDIIGFFVRRAAASRKTKTGRTLAADAVLNAAFITFSNGNASALESFPLENCVSDPTIHPPGSYVQTAFPPGIRLNRCKIEMPAGTTLVADTAIEITLIYIFDDNC